MKGETLMGMTWKEKTINMNIKLRREVEKRHGLGHVPRSQLMKDGDQ